jgi:hypothetical protein
VHLPLIGDLDNSIDRLSGAAAPAPIRPHRPCCAGGPIARSAERVFILLRLGKCPCSAGIIVRLVPLSAQWGITRQLENALSIAGDLEVPPAVVRQRA